MSREVRIGLTLLRVAVASVFVVHGIARMVNGTVGGFGQFLAAQGLPLGVVVAWTLTLVEVAGGLEVLETEVVTPKWSFMLVARKPPAAAAGAP